MNKKANQSSNVLGRDAELFGDDSGLAGIVKPASSVSADLDAESKKTRRRSALMEEAGFEGSKTRGTKSEDVKVLGFEQRNARLTECGADELSGTSPDEFNKLLAKGVYMLGMREHSTQEMQDKLSARSDSADLVMAVVDELLEHNYLSDERFAQSYVRSRANKGFGPMKIKTELSSKGVSNRLISEYLDSGSAKWFDVAREQYDKKYSSSNVKDYKEWTKRARFLQSRGFSMEHIQAVQPSSGFY